MVWTNGSTIYVTYYLYNGSNTVTPTISTPFPSSWTSLASFLSSMHVDQATGEVTLRMCTSATSCTTSVSSYPGYHINHANSGLPFTIARDYSNSLYLTGWLDDVRVLPRTATQQEVAEFFGSEPWTIASRDVAHGGEVFLFDGDLRGVSGTEYVVLHGTEGTDFAFGAVSTPTRLAHTAPVVQYEEAQDLRRYDGEPSHTCCASTSCGGHTPSPQEEGSIIGRRNEAVAEDLLICEVGNRPNHFGVYEATASATCSTPPCYHSDQQTEASFATFTACEELPASDGDLITRVVGTQGGHSSLASP
jgi:hypothetical protein